MTHRMSKWLICLFPKVEVECIYIYIYNEPHCIYIYRQEVTFVSIRIQVNQDVMVHKTAPAVLTTAQMFEDRSRCFRGGIHVDL